MSDHGRYRIGIDVGGTFTDFVMAETQGARLIVHKEASVPDDAARPTARGVTALTFDMGRTRSDVSQVIGGLPEIAQNSMVGDYPLMLPVVGVSAVGGRRSAQTCSPGGASARILRLPCAPHGAALRHPPSRLRQAIAKPLRTPRRR